MKIKVCYRHPTSGDIEQCEADYEGFLSEKVIKAFNKMFLAKAAGDRFYPLDAMDAYHDVWLALNRKADELHAFSEANPGESMVTNASEDTYLIKAASLMFLNWHQRKVVRTREEHRAILKLSAGEYGARGEDNFDADNWNPVEAELKIKGMSLDDSGDNYDDDINNRDIVREIGERIENTSQFIVPTGLELLGAKESELNLSDPQLKARKRLGEICEMLLCDGQISKKLAQEIVYAFRLYIALDGNLLAVANNLKAPKSTFYRHWTRYLKIAKKVWENHNSRDTI